MKFLRLLLYFNFLFWLANFLSSAWADNSDSSNQVYHDIEVKAWKATISVYWFQKKAAPYPLAAMFYNHPMFEEKADFRQNKIKELWKIQMKLRKDLSLYGSNLKPFYFKPPEFFSDSNKKLADFNLNFLLKIKNNSSLCQKEIWESLIHNGPFEISEIRKIASETVALKGNCSYHWNVKIQTKTDQSPRVLSLNYFPFILEPQSWEERFHFFKSISLNWRFGSQQIVGEFLAAYQWKPSEHLALGLNSTGSFLAQLEKRWDIWSQWYNFQTFFQRVNFFVNLNSYLNLQRILEFSVQTGLQIKKSDSASAWAWRIACYWKEELSCFNAWQIYF